MICCLVLCTLLNNFASAIIKGSFPINNQVPPVARIFQSYTYQFAPNTFTTTTGQELVYSISEAPAWLELDSASHTLRGTPAPPDEGAFTFVLSATDGFGHADSQVSLVVVSDVAPCLTGNISAALAATGTLSGPATLALAPDTSFTIHLGRDYFQSSNPIFLYATSEGRSPLPSWISFDAVTAIFTGTAPQPATAPRVYGIVLVASQVAGFAEVDAPFAISVANHKLLFTSITMSVTMSTLAEVFIDIGAFLTLDGLPAPVDSIADTSLSGPAWLTFDSPSLLLRGSPPEGTLSEQVNVSVSDVYGDDASMAIQLSFVLSMSSPIPASKTQVLSASAKTLASGLITTHSELPQQTSAVNSSSMGSGLARAATEHRGNLSRGDIAAAVVLPFLFFVGILWLCLIIVHRRKRRCLEQSSEKEGNRGADNNAEQEVQRRGFRNSWLPPIGLGIGTEPNSSWPEISQSAFASVPEGPDELRASQSNATRGASDQLEGDLAYMFNPPPPSVGKGYSNLSSLVEESLDMPSRQRQIRPSKSVLLSADWATAMSQLGPVLPGAGHGRATTGFAGSGNILPSNNCSSATSTNYGSWVTEHSANSTRTGRDTLARDAARKSTFGLQRMSTIRKVSSKASDDLAGPAERPFSELRQSFINCRASNPHRPLFSAGLAVLRDPTVADDRKSGSILGDVVPAGQDIERNPRARFTRAENMFQDGYPRAASQQSSSAWNDVDSDSRYTLDESERASVGDETDQVAALRVREPSSAQVPIVAGKEEASVMSSEPSTMAGNSAFI